MADIVGNASNYLTVASSAYQVFGLIINITQAIANEEIDSPEDFINLLLGGGTNTADELINQKLDDILGTVNALSDQLTEIGAELTQQIDAQTGLIINLDVVDQISTINAARSKLSSYDPYATEGSANHFSEGEIDDLKHDAETSLQNLIGIGNLIIKPTSGYTPNIDTIIAVANAIAYAVEFRLQVAGRFEGEELAANYVTGGLKAAAKFFEKVASYVPQNVDVDVSIDLHNVPSDGSYIKLDPGHDIDGDGFIDNVMYTYVYAEAVASVNNIGGLGYTFSTQRDPVAILQALPDIPLPEGSIMFGGTAGTINVGIVDTELLVNASGVPQFALDPALQVGSYNLVLQDEASMASLILKEIVRYDLLERLGISFADDGTQTNAYTAFAETLHQLTNGIEAGVDADGNVDGTEGRDLLKGNGSNNVVNGFGDNDTLYGYGGRDELNGGDGDDIIRGHTGDDVLDGGTGSNLMYGGAGNDILRADGSSRMEGGDGNDVLEGGAGRYIMFGGADDDKLIGGFENDALSGDEGDDVISGGGGSDMISGGDGNDKLSGGAGSDTMFGDAGDDLLKGGSGSGGDVLYGGDGNDRLVSGGGLSRLIGGAGNDKIEGEEGRSFGRFDTAVFAGERASYDLDATLEKVIVKGPDGRDTVAGVEYLEFDDTTVDVVRSSFVSVFNAWLASGSGAEDILIGNDEDENMSGGGGDDIILGGKGNDTIEGDGYLSVSDGADLLDGGAGDDIISGDGGNDKILGRNGNDDLNGGLGDDELRGLNGNDILRGHRGKDLLVGGKGQDQMFGGLGNDVLLGDDSDDRLDGGQGADRLSGGNGRDRLSGGTARDFLDGGAGNDLLTGGQGNDLFLFADGFGVDRIFDFDPTNDKEKIDLSAVTAITGFADLSAHHMSQSGSDVIIDDLLGNTIRLDNVLLADLGRGDFVF